MKRLALGYLLFGLLLFLALALVLHAAPATGQLEGQNPGSHNSNPQQQVDSQPSRPGNPSPQAEARKPDSLGTAKAQGTDTTRGIKGSLACDTTLTVKELLLCLEQRLTGLERRGPSVALLFVLWILAGLVGGLVAAGVMGVRQSRRPSSDTGAAIRRELEHLWDKLEHIRKTLAQVRMADPSGELWGALRELKGSVDRLHQGQQQVHESLNQVLEKFQGLSVEISQSREDLQTYRQQLQELQRVLQQRLQTTSVPTAPVPGRRTGPVGIPTPPKPPTPPRPLVDIKQRIQEIKANWQRWNDEEKRRVVEEMKRYGYDVRDPLLEGKKHNYYGDKFEHRRSPQAREVRVIHPLIEHNGKEILKGLKEGP